MLVQIRSASPAEVTAGVAPGRLAVFGSLDKPGAGLDPRLTEREQMAIETRNDRAFIGEDVGRDGQIPMGRDIPEERDFREKTQKVIAADGRRQKSRFLSHTRIGLRKIRQPRHWYAENV